jgi:hypothetical protein
MHLPSSRAQLILSFLVLILMIAGFVWVTNNHLGSSASDQATTDLSSTTPTTPSPASSPDISPDLDKEIEEIVAMIKSTVELPMAIDNYTTWMDITAEPNAIHYFYQANVSLQEIGLTEELLNSSLISQGCTTPETLELLRAGVTMNYTYTFNQPEDILTTSFDLSDCE